MVLYQILSRNYENRDNLALITWYLQFVRGQSDPELKKYLWVVIRTQKDKKLQTLIEVCTDFASLSQTTNVHRPAEQVFALEEDDDREEEMFAVRYHFWDCERSFLSSSAA